MLARIVAQVAMLEVGQRIQYDMRFLEQHIAGYRHNGAWFTPADRVLENVIGSAYGWSYHINEPRELVTFERRADDGRRTYTSPDRR